MPEILFERVARHRLLEPIHRTGVLVRIFGIEDVVARDLADRDAVGKLARHHDEIADLCRVGELIELRGEIPEPVPPPVRHHLRQMLQDGVTVRVAPKIVHFEKSG